MKSFFIGLALIIAPGLMAQHKTPFESGTGNQTPEYSEIVKWWTLLDKSSSMVQMNTAGMTDAGYPLHLIIVSKDGAFNFNSIHKKNKIVILINNGIHPGEPDGIDASMLLIRDISEHKISLPDNVVLGIIPVYNIGGCLDRSTEYRVDQNGPEAFGFRGNSQNLDLNRDFIKCDSKEAKAFAGIFHLTDPDIFIDNHVSDGADYQHVMTLISTQHNKLGGIMGEYLNTNLEPGLYSSMKNKGFDLIPYVNAFDGKPEQGWPQFMDWPRYSSGYAATWSCFSFITETHMLKPYPQRVKATYELMRTFIEFASNHATEIKQARIQTRKAELNQKEFPLSWISDRSQSSTRLYKGYESTFKSSEVSGLPRLYYDRNKPFDKIIPFYDYYKPNLVAEKPAAYIIPQGWWKVIDLLKLNRVQMHQFLHDTLIQVEITKIMEYKSSARQYEMHHPNSQVKTNTSMQMISFHKGDFYIPMNQTANRFLMEVLEPTGPDSYFTWNFFDSVLGQKEGFSDYAFEDIAADYLKTHPDIQSALDKKRMEDTAFSHRADLQLEFVYNHSPWVEPAYMRYPVYRVKK
ncbi:MAG: M14 family metallopeptidase [Saprospiraceae bacterium]